MPQGDLDWALHFLDGTTVRAHQHAAGAQKGAAIKPSAAPGAASRPKSTCGSSGWQADDRRPDRRASGTKPPSGCVAGAGGRHAAGTGSSPHPADGVVGDKGYTGQPMRAYLRRRGIGAVIPRRANESRRGTRFDQAAYRERNIVERTINRLKQHRAIATRYEKLAVTYHALLTIACILLWL